MEEKVAFDFKKEFKEFYLPKNKPEIVNVPEMNYIQAFLQSDSLRQSDKANLQ